LIGTTQASHPAHIHENNVATGGNIIGLNPVNGTGISKTQVAT
jgi:hypothetical protein